MELLCCYFFPGKKHLPKGQRVSSSLEKNGIDPVLRKTWFKNLTTAMFESDIPNDAQQFLDL